MTILPATFNVEPTTGIEPVNLILTKDVLYLLSYVGPPQAKGINTNKMHKGKYPE